MAEGQGLFKQATGLFRQATGREFNDVLQDTKQGLQAGLDVAREQAADVAKGLDLKDLGGALKPEEEEVNVYTGTIKCRYDMVHPGSDAPDELNMFTMDSSADGQLTGAKLFRDFPLGGKFHFRVRTRDA